MAQSTKTRNLQTKIVLEKDNQNNKAKPSNSQGPRSLKNGPAVPTTQVVRDTRPLPRKKREPAFAGLNQKKQNPTVRGPAISGSSKSNVLQTKSLTREKKEPTMLHGRQASVTRTNATIKEQIQNRLKKKSPWYDSIMDPISGGGVKIPDPIGTDTGTYQHVENVSVAVNEKGVAGLRIVSPYINSYNGGSADGSNYQVTTATSSVTDLAFGGGPGQPGLMNPFKGIPAIMKANSKNHRVVSASVIVQPEVSTLNDAGEICAFVTPFSCNDATVPYVTLQYQWDSMLLPVNVHKPAIARHYPLEADFEPFNGFEIQHSDAITNDISYRDFIDPTIPFTENDVGVIPWEIGAVCTGMTPSTGVVRFQICVNYEFIPVSSTAMVTTESSPIDPMEEQLVNSWVSDCPITSVISQKDASKAPTGSSVPEEQTGFGMFADVVKEVIPFAKQMLPLLL